MNKIYKIFSAMLFSALMLILSVSVNASETITVDKNSMNIVVDGDRVFADNFVYDNTTYVPLRRIAEMLGKKVEWNADVYGAFISDTDSPDVTTSVKEGLDLQKGKSITVDRNTMKIFVNGEEVKADNFVYAETTYVPLRKISEMFKKEVVWEKLSNTATIGEAGIGFFDGEVLGTINGIEYTDYMYEYYSSVYDYEYEYHQMMGEDVSSVMKSRDEYIIEALKKDYALIDYALKNGYCMTPLYHASYYDTVNSTLEGVKGDMEKFERMLEMQGFTSLNSYYYAMLVSDLYVQYSAKFEEEITDAEVLAFYEDNEELKYQYSLAEATPDIVRILCKKRTDEDIEKMAKALVVEVK